MKDITQCGIGFYNSKPKIIQGRKEVILPDQIHFTKTTIKIF